MVHLHSSYRLGALQVNCGMKFRVQNADEELTLKKGRKESRIGWKQELNWNGSLTKPWPTGSSGANITHSSHSVLGRMAGP